MLALWVYMQERISRVLRRAEGQGMVEYGLIIALVAIGLIVALVAMRGQLAATFTCIKDHLASAISNQPAPQNC